MDRAATEEVLEVLVDSAVLAKRPAPAEGLLPRYVMATQDHAAAAEYAASDPPEFRENARRRVTEAIGERLVERRFSSTMCRYYSIWASLFVVGTLAAACGGDASKHGPDLFSAVPDPCSLVSVSMVSSVLNDPASGALSSGVGQLSCSWRHDVGRTARSPLPQPYRREIDVSVTFYARQDGQSGADRAARTFELLQNDPGMGKNDPLPGVGDESYVWFGKYGLPEEGVEFLKSNVTLTVRYGGIDVDQNGQAVNPPELELRPGATQVALEVAKNLDRAH